MRIESLDKSFEAFRDDVVTFKDDVVTFKDDVMTKLDKMTGILENLDLDREIGAEQSRELREQVDNHETRIAKLESSLS